MIWQSHGLGYQRSFYSGPTFIRSFFTVASGAVAIVSTFWCALTGMSAITGGGDIERLDSC